MLIEMSLYTRLLNFGEKLYLVFQLPFKEENIEVTYYHMVSFLRKAEKTLILRSVNFSERVPG